VEAGILSLDDPLILHLPDFPNPEQGARITIRQLINHTSGLHEYEPADTERWLKDGTPLTREFMFDYLRGRPLDFEPGTQWSYSNTGFYLAALVIENVIGTTYGDHMRQLTGYPVLGLRDTGMCSDPTWRSCATGYDASDGRLQPGRLYRVPGIMGDGGMCSTASALVHLPGILTSRRGMRWPGLDEMLTPTRLTNGVTVDYGLGVRLGMLGGHRLWGHTGGMGTYWSALAHYPDDDLTIVVLVNTDNADEDALTIEGAIARVALGLGKPVLKDLRLSKGDAKAFSGVYQDATSRVRISGSPDHLSREVVGGGGGPRALLYQGDGVFGWAQYPMDRMVYHVQEGRAVGISEYYNGMFATYKRRVPE
jgi:CubicO group peptidase (beta-lactamase class C family)